MHLGQRLPSKTTLLPTGAARADKLWLGRDPHIGFVPVYSQYSPLPGAPLPTGDYGRVPWSVSNVCSRLRVAASGAGDAGPAPAHPHPHPPSCVWCSRVGPEGRHSVQGTQARPMTTLCEPAVTLLTHFVDGELRPTGVRPWARVSKTTRPRLRARVAWLQSPGSGPLHKQELSIPCRLGPFV